MMDEFENNRENEHVDQTPHAECVWAKNHTLISYS